MAGEIQSLVPRVKISRLWDGSVCVTKIAMVSDYGNKV